MNYDDIIEADNLLNKRRDCIVIIDDLNSNEAKKSLLESLNDKKAKFEARLKELGVVFETRRGNK